jgi:hypothetical protein
MDVVVEDDNTPANMVEPVRTLDGMPTAAATMDDLGPISRADIEAEPGMESYQLNPLPDGEPMQATLVNAVFMSRLMGSSAKLPWIDPRIRFSGFSPVALHQRLLGLVCPVMPSNNRSFGIKFTRPFNTTHGIFPMENTIQELAVTNCVLGDFAVHFSTALMAVACELPHLQIRSRTSSNRVYTAYMPYEIDYDLALRTNKASTKQQKGHFKTLTYDLPYSSTIRILAFARNPIILVGAQCTSQMRPGMDYTLPKIYDVCIRGDDEDDDDGRPTTTADKGRKRKYQEMIMV